MTLINQIKDLVNRVENGDMTAENARKFTGEEGKWVTIKGTHVFIPEGKEVDEVIKEKFGETEEKTDKKEEKKETSKEGTEDIEKLLSEHKKWKEKSTEAEKKYTENPDNKFLEERFKIAEKRNVEALSNLVDTLHKQVGEEYTKDELKKLLFTQPDKIEKLFAKTQPEGKENKISKEIQDLVKQDIEADKKFGMTEEKRKNYYKDEQSYISTKLMQNYKKLSPEAKTYITEKAQEILDTQKMVL